MERMWEIGDKLNSRILLADTTADAQQVSAILLEEIAEHEAKTGK